VKNTVDGKLNSRMQELSNGRRKKTGKEMRVCTDGTKMSISSVVNSEGLKFVNKQQEG
jgi:hypothetical protein